MSDYLRPVDGYFSDLSHAYHLRVRETLLVHYSNSSTPLASLVVLPSFTPEYALWIGKNGQRYYAVYRVGKASIWQSMQQPLAAPVSFHTCNAELPPELAKALVAIFWATLGQTRYSDRDGIKLDGTDYYFAAYQVGNGLRSGQTWSPNTASNPGKLVHLTQSLIQQLIQPTNSPDCWLELTKTAVALHAEFSAA